MVNALARYQKTVLAPYFKSVAPRMIAWESSDALHQTDSGLATIATTIIVQAILVIGPSLVLLSAMLYFIAHPVGLSPLETRWEWSCILLSATLTGLAIFFTLLTITHRRKLREEPR